MIMGYGMHGYCNEALEMFSRMCEVRLKCDEILLLLEFCQLAAMQGL